MIKKLRIKFVIINMTLVLTVLLIVFVMLYLSTSQDLIRQSNDALHEATNQLIFENLSVGGDMFNAEAGTATGSALETATDPGSGSVSASGAATGSALETATGSGSASASGAATGSGSASGNTYNNIKGNKQNAGTSTEGALSANDPQDDIRFGATGKPQIGVSPDRGGNFRMHLSLMPTFGVILDDKSEILVESKEKVSISDDILNRAIKEAVENENKSGILNSLDLRYLKSTREDKTIITFIDRNDELSNLKSLIVRSVIIGLCGLLGFLAISIFLSYWTLKPAETAWKQQKQFVADASHELKTPLTVILANTEILMSHKSELIEKHEQWLDSTRDEGIRMKQLIDSMLFLAKSDFVKNEIISDLTDFSEIVEICMLNFEPLAYEKGVELFSDEIERDLFVMGDSGQLKQLTAILTDNACKYAGKGGKATAKLYHEGENIVLSVNNTGNPISPDDLPHVFERFYRADRARVSSGDSFGLGLAIAKKIVENHHGKISVRSNEADGTTFTVKLPEGRKPEL